MAMSKEQGDAVWLERWPDYVLKATQIHNGKYSYPSPERITTSNKWGYRHKIRILCPEHGEFLQGTAKHLSGQACPKCLGIGTDKIAELKQRFLDWDWSGVEFGHTKQTFTLVCPEHGEFQTSYNRLTTKKGQISPCPKCSKIIAGKERRNTVEQWQEKLQATWGDEVVVDPSSIVTAGDKAKFTCKFHGEFVSILQDVVSGHGCPTCGKNRFISWMDVNVRVTPEEFEKRANEVHKGRYKYRLETYVEMREKMAMLCDKHGEFWQEPSNHIGLEAGCPSCAGRDPKAEREIRTYIGSLGFEVTEKARILDGWEIDVYIPEKKLGIEHCGLYWHGEKHKDAGYHKEKYTRAKNAGITLLTVFEDEWMENSEKVRHKLLHLLGASERIYARDTELRHIAWKVAAPFLEEHHLAGKGKPGSASLGLYHNKELVAVSSWGEERFSDDGHLEMYRFCSKQGVTIIGGLSKMIKEVKSTDRSLVTYSDLRWGEGLGYEKVGFTRLEDTVPGYFWCKATKRFSRQKFQKHKLASLFSNFDPSKTEVENCHNNGYWRIYDCGHSKWVML